MMMFPTAPPQRRLRDGRKPGAPGMRVHLCGTLSVQVDGRETADAISGRQGRVLLAYLVANRGEPVRRDELIDVVWQGQPPSAPEASLSSLLTSVRRTLGQDTLTGRSVLTLTLPADTWVDVEEARAATAAAEAALAAGDPGAALERARAALDLTGQPVLAGMAGEWVEQLRSELAQLRFELLETATRSAVAVGEVAAAERMASSLIELEPYRESGYGLLMEALALGGNVAEALLTFDRVRVMLRDELGVPPAPALTALHERLLGQTAPAPAPRSSAPDLPLPGAIARGDRGEFVGRAPELRRLRGRWDQVRRGQGALVLVTGEPGIGKTRLAARFAADIHATGGLVVYGRTDEETVEPYQPFVQTLRHLVAHVDPLDLDPALAPQLDELRPLLPELAKTGSPRTHGEDGRYALFEAAALLLDRLARLAPVLVVLEDMHFADTPTLLLLRRIVRQAEAAPIMVLATYSDVGLTLAAPLQRVLADLRRDQALERISLAGLDREAAATLIAARAPGAADAAQLREYTSGNPFFIGELLRSIGETGQPGVPEGVREVLLRRLARLDPATLEVLTYAAVLGREFPLAPLALLAGEPPEDVLVRLEEAADAGLVVEDTDAPGRFAFCHGLVRDAVYERPAAARRGLLHLRAGIALEQASGRAGELAHHFFAARHHGGGERAVRYAVEAGAEAARAYAYEDAAAHFERALEALALVPDPDDGLRAEIWLALGTVRWQGGEPGARAAFDAAAEIASLRGDAPMLVRAALGAGGRFYAPGRPDPAYVDLLERALAAAPATRTRARLLGRLAETLTDGPRRAEVSAEAVRLARADGDPAGLAPALLSRHAAHLHPRHLDERLALAGDAVALADAAALGETAALARHWLIYDLVEAGDLDAAHGRQEELATLARELQQPLYQHSALAWRGVWAQLAGRAEEAERLAREGLRLAERARARDARAHFTGQLLAILRDQGRLPELLPDLERLVAERSEVLPWRALLPLAKLDAGDAVAAGAAFDAALADGQCGLLWLPAHAWLAEAAALLGRTDACATLLERLAPYEGRLVQASFTGCWGAVERPLGLLARALGREAEAARYLDAALERHERIGAAPLARRSRGEL
jgi:DNA-binding SARP family transcriptional activator